MSFAPYIAAHRFGLGASLEEMSIIARNPRSWVLNQIRSSTSTELKGSFQSTKQIAASLMKKHKPSKEERREIRKQGARIYTNEIQARFQQAITSKTPVIEHLTVFWSNHFTVSALGKNQLKGIVGAYEREAIRPHILGKFSDMLLAVVQHPAMLIYLDNAQSFGPLSKIGLKRKRGLNENLAREILELHTLGVNGGYKQEDVIGLAKIITGWTIVPPRKGGGGFKYLERAHEPGMHKLLGKTYGANGYNQGIAALKDLANHPSTAKFIATKMARHFISDTPSNASIKALERTFLRTDGDLRKMMETLINMKEVWQTPLPKIKKPYELIVSSFRLTGIDADHVPFKRIAESLSLLEHLPFQAPSPAGWPDTLEDWISPNAMMNRVEWCHAFAQAVRPKDNPLKIAQIALGGVADPETLLWIDRAPSAVDGLALLLASPEWQRR